MAELSNQQAAEWHNNEINQAIAKLHLGQRDADSLAKVVNDPLEKMISDISTRVKASDALQQNWKEWEQLKAKNSESFTSLNDTVSQAKLNKLDIVALNLILQNEAGKIFDRAKGLPSSVDEPSLISKQERYIINQVVDKRQELEDKVVTGELTKSVKHTAAHFNDNTTNLPYYGQPSPSPF